ncbi:outer membrane protein [Microbaculum marinum]|uniref:Outer membrane beta-barrel protein n=2 Tax=Microbaculum marinum TaxID=1764581 RepID=A0AAW9RPJ7_9HYPH
MAAKAADMPQYTPPPVVTAVPLWDWSGFYLGLNAGYGWGQNGGANMSFTDPGAAFFGPCLVAGSCVGGLSYDTDGFVGGAQAGYNWQINQFVLGIEADIEYSDMNGGAGFASFVPPFAAGSFTSTSEINWLATLRGRLGVAVDRTLIYATGGLAAGGVDDNFRWGYPTINQVYVGDGSDTEWGWVVGAGLEYAMTDNFILGAEVLYFDLGSTSVPGVPVAGFIPPAGTSITANYDHDGVIARARASYKF